MLISENGRMVRRSGLKNLENHRKGPEERRSNHQRGEAIDQIIENSKEGFLGLSRRCQDERRSYITFG